MVLSTISFKICLKMSRLMWVFHLPIIFQETFFSFDICTEQNQLNYISYNDFQIL